MVPAEPGVVRPPTNRIAAGVAYLVIATMVAAFVLFVQPTTTFITKRDCAERAADGSCALLGDSEAVERAIAPASATAVGPLVSVTGAKTFPASGDVLLVTVRQPVLNMLDWLAVRANPAASLHSHEDLFGTQTPDEQRKQSLAAMINAKDIAEYVALTRAGYDAKVIPGAVVVNQFSCLEVKDGKCVREVEASTKLRQGDTLLRVDGTDTPTLSALRDVLSTHKPGDVVSIVYSRTEDGKVSEGTTSITTLPAPDDQNRPIIGFLPQDTDTVQLPEGIKVEISTRDIGGPSAGLAFTLSLIDKLTEGDLFGGQRVAVTGTIDIDGVVGPIGGLSSKGSAVKQRGIKYFIVPRSQGEGDLARLARVVGSDVEIIPVDTVDEALTALEHLGSEQNRSSR